jgi:WD40 repeat protein
MQPRPAVLLESGRFLAEDSPDSVVLYDGAAGNAVYRFAASSIHAIAVSPDETRVLIACDDGTLKLCDLRTGATAWSKTPAESGLGEVCDADFSRDGKSLVVCDFRGRAVVYDATAGRQVGAVQFPPMESHILSASLGPDGSRGVLVDLDEHVFTFDAATGVMRDTGLTGAWPIRFSSDGRFFACRNSNQGLNEQLSVVAVANMTATDVGEFDNIGHIRPTRDGKFLVTGDIRRGGGAGRPVGPGGTTGTRYDPVAGRLERLWTLTGDTMGRSRTDFDPETMTGVSTDYRLVTTVIDLTTGAPRRTLDHSANYRAVVVSTYRRGLPIRKWVLPAAGVVLLVLAAVRGRRARRRLQ